MKRIFKCICVISLCVLLTGCFGKKTNKVEEKVNKTVIDNKNVIKEQEVDGVKISDIQLSVSDGLSTYTAKVTNTSKKDISIEDAEKEFVGKRYGEFKTAVADVVCAELEPFQNRYKEIVETKAYEAVLKEGQVKAKAMAHKTLEKVQEAVGLLKI